MAVSNFKTSSIRTGVTRNTMWDQVSTIPLLVEYLVIAGGGGGASSNDGNGGGGGAGGYRTATNFSVLRATSVALTVGAGGTAGAGGAGEGGTNGGKGANSVFSTITSTGGGGGGKYQGSTQNNAGSGGSGVVILSVPTSLYTGTTTGSPSVTTNGSNTIIIFKSSGTYTA